MLQEKSFQTGEVEINYAEGPDSGPALLMLHGVTANWRAGLPLITTLASRYHIYAPDFRGHGKSGRIPDSYQVKKYVRDTRALIEQVVRQPVAIFGHSLGGRVALMLAAQLPGLIRAITVGDTPLNALTQVRADFYRAFEAWRDLIRKGLSVDELVPGLAEVTSFVKPDGTVVKFKDLAGWDEAYLRYTASYLTQVDPEILEIMAAGGPPWDPTGLMHEMEKITCPVLLLQGNPALGGLMTDQDVTRAKSLLKSSIHVRIDNAGHGLHSNDPVAVCRVLLFFLESL